MDRVTPLEERIAATLQRERFVLALIGAFGLAALLLAALGVYGLIDLLVHRRTHEMGLRMALGARPEEVRQMILRAGAGLAGAGLVLGLAATALASRWTAASLYRTDPLDPTSLMATALVIGGAALLATWLPAQRATRIDPASSLRGDSGSG